MANISLTEPDWIYEGSDEDQMEAVNGVVTNRAPRDIEDNVKTIKSVTENLSHNFKAIVLDEYHDWDDETTYYKGDIVRDPDNTDKHYNSITDDNLNHSVTDTDYWTKYNGIGNGSPKVINSDYTAYDNDYLLCDTNANTDDYTIKLPDAPANTDIITFGDYSANAGSNPVDVDGNGKNIEGNSSASLDIDGFYVKFMFNGDEDEWKILNK